MASFRRMIVLQMPTPQVHVVDDDPLVLILVSSILRAEGYAVQTYDHAEAFLDDYDPGSPGCLILDVYLPGMLGTDLQRELADRGNTAPVLFLSGAEELTLAVDAMRDGALDFIRKPVDARLLLPAVERAMELDVANRMDLAEIKTAKERVNLLTDREREVLKWIVHGESSKSIAQIISISSRTVEVHRRNISAKLEARSIAELVRLGLKAGVE